MSLLTSPQTVNDGVADQVFTWRCQLPTSNGSIVGQYQNLAATIAAQSNIFVKHLEGPKIVRSALQKTEIEFDANGVEVGRVTANLTLTYAKTNTSAFVKKQGMTVVNAAEVAGVMDRLIQKSI